ncbi:hypothetical protein O1L60_21920 [Streptomyces diastatochromogenes]|nr:hypothetical protein [Streptomyces diastatochromogenes]
MTGLKPIEDEGTLEVRALAQALRDLFQGLGVSTRRYAIRRSYDSGTVSRYLGGRRLPPWKFVLDLLHDVAEERGTLPTEETVAMLRALHTAAVNSGNGATHKVLLLERRLAEADRAARGAATRERALEEALQDREHRIRDLQLRERELRAGAAPFGAAGGGRPRRVRPAARGDRGPHGRTGPRPGPPPPGGRALRAAGAAAGGGGGGGGGSGRGEAEGAST